MPGACYQITLADAFDTPGVKTERSDITIYFETEDSGITILMTSTHPLGDGEWETQRASLSLDKEEVGHLLTFLTTIHPMMADDD